MGKVSFILSQGQKSLKPGSYIGFCAVLNAIQTKDNEANLNIYCLNCRNATYEPGLRKLKNTVSLDRSLSPILGDIISFRAGWMSWQDSCMGRWEIAIVYDQENFIIFYQRNVGILDSNALAIVPINFTWNIYQVPSPHFLIYLGVGGEILYKF